MGDSYKYIIEEIRFIEDLSKTRLVRILDNKSITAKSGYLKKLKPKGFALEIASGHHWQLDTGEHLKASILSRQLSFKITDAYVKSVGASFTPNKNTHRSKIHIFSFQAKRVSKSQKTYYRTIIPIKTGFAFHNIFKEESYSYDGDFRTRGLIKITLEHKLFDAFIKDHEKRKYLVIDCLEKSTLEEFSELSWSIMASMGYLAGHLVQDEAYTFCYRNKHLKGFSNFIYSQRRDTLKSFYTPVNANPFLWIKENRRLAQKYYGKISEISSLQLSMLCQIVHEQIDIKAIILLITESITRSLLLMPAGLSVALEGMSEYFVSKNSTKLKPIKEEEIADSFKKDLMEVLNKYKVVDGFTGYTVMERKIQNINSPTNREKLKAPFIVLDIPLTEIDEEILEYRNDFLHGNINLKPQKWKKSYSMDSFEISLRLLTLLNMAIMKMIGYNGYIINHVKTQEHGLGKKIEEQYYREI